MAQKLRIPVETLRTKVEALVVEARERHRAAKAKFEEDRKAHRKAVVSALRAEASRIDKGGKYDTRFFGGNYRLEVRAPAPPQTPEAPGQLERDLTTLKATDQEYVLVDAENRLDYWGRYL